MKNPVLVLVKKWRGWSKVQHGLVVVLTAGLGVLLVGNWPMRMKGPKDTAAPAYPPMNYQANDPATPGAGSLDATTRVDAEKQFSDTKLQANEPRATAVGASPYGTPTPLIAHTAELAVATKEFSKARTSLEEILERHRAYAAKLRMVGQKSGSVLNATLRVPSAELAATVSDLKSLGEVEQEAQLADEVTQQHGDLEARLANARATLRRLQELLQKQTYPDGNVRELQRQIGNASGEVARLEAERQSSEHRVTFASVQFSMREVLAQPEESLGAQLHSAATAGFGEAAASISALLLFLIGRGPVVVLWCAILFLPARYLWKRWQPIAVRPTEAAQGD
jgi:hypothetical protein